MSIMGFFSQTMLRQLNRHNGRIIETIELLRLLLLCGLDCDIFYLISERACGCLAMLEGRAVSASFTWIYRCNISVSTEYLSTSSTVLLAKMIAFISK